MSFLDTEGLFVFIKCLCPYLEEAVFDKGSSLNEFMLPKLESISVFGSLLLLSC